MTNPAESLTQVESLKLVADQYFEHAMSIGVLEMSHIAIRNGIVHGHTSTETDSGVKITKHSNGLLTVKSNFVETTKNGIANDLEREITVSPNGTVDITDRRERTEDGEWTGEGGSRTIPARDHKAAITEMVKLINIIY